MPHRTRWSLFLLALVLVAAPTSGQADDEPAMDSAASADQEDHGKRKAPQVAPEVSPLIAAVLANDVARVRALLGDGADPNSLDARGSAALHHAATQGRTEMIPLLLAAGAKLLGPNADGELPAHFAADAGQLETLRALVAAGTAIETKGRFQSSLLQAAAARGQANCVAWLLSQHARVDDRNSYRMTPLHQAASTRSLETVRLLIEAGADLAAVDHEGKTALHNAATNRDPAIAAALLERGAGIGAKDSAGRTPTDYAFGYGQPEVLRRLLAAGGRILDLHGAFWTAVTNGNAEGVRLLLEQGLEVSKGDLLLTASRGRSEEIGLLLLAKGAPFASASADGVARAAVHNAALMGHVRLLAALLDAGEDVNRADGGGATALHHAARQGHADAVELLLVRGARVDAAGAAGSTPLHEAAHGPIDHRPSCGPAPDWARETPQYVRAIAALTKAGADPDRADEYGNTPRKLLEANANAEFRAEALAALKS